MKTSYPAGGWLPPGAHLELKWDDQGRDFATNWGGHVQAPGDGECIAVLSDRPFPNGFGPDYPVVRIDTGMFRGHEFYIGHNTSLVKPGEKFGFGHPLAVANQGHNWAGTTGGWVELGEAFNGLPGPKTGRKWFDDLLEKPLVINHPDPPLHYGMRGFRVLGMTSDLRDCGWLSRPYFTFNRDVHGAVVAFKQYHHLPMPSESSKQDRGVVEQRCAAAIKHAATDCKKHHTKEH